MDVCSTQDMEKITQAFGGNHDNGADILEPPATWTTDPDRAPDQVQIVTVTDPKERSEVSIRIQLYALCV